MTNKLVWMDKTWGRLLTASGAGMLGAAILLALNFFFDIDIKSTPVYQARVGLQPHRPIQLVYSIPNLDKNRATMLFSVDELVSGVRVGNEKAEIQSTVVSSKWTIEVRGPERGEFAVRVFDDHNAEKVMFTIPAKRKTSIRHDGVLIPEASEPKINKDEKRFTEIGVTIHKHVGVFTLIED